MTDPTVFFRGPSIQKMSDGASGYDIAAQLDSSLYLLPHLSYRVPTGVYLQLPANFEAQVRPRSGLSLRTHLQLPNSPGTIDSDYRGELVILVRNVGAHIIIIHSGDRIAQLVFCTTSQIALVEKAEHTTTQRDSGGFGSTQ